MMRPRVSIVIVNWNGREHLEACLGSVAASDYPAECLEVILVDNGSTDGSAALVRSRFPQVSLVSLPENRGFTGGNEAGVAAARGDVLVFLNNDVRVAPGAVSALVAAVERGCECAAARLLSWDGSRIDFIQGTASFEGLGFQEHCGEPVNARVDPTAATFFPNGGAFAVARAAYDRAGGFDPRYFAYYDDVDLGWRLRLTGAAIRRVPDAVVYHRHGATSRRHPAPQKRFLLARNALWTVLKNYAPDTRDRALAPVLLLAVRRIVQETRLARGSSFARALAPFSARCRRQIGAGWRVLAADVYDTAGSEASGTSASPDEPLVRRFPVERLAALGTALSDPRNDAVRDDVQRRRAVSDTEIVPLMGRGLRPASSLPSYRDAHEALVERFGLTALFRGVTRLLIVTHEPLGDCFSGPGIRVLEIGRALASSAQVTIAAPADPGFRDDRCTIVPYTPGDARSLRAAADGADAVLVQGFSLTSYPFLRDLGVPIVADLYCPFTIEHLEMHRSAAAALGGSSPGSPGGHAAAIPERVSQEAARVLAVQNEQLRRADYFICASERQRDFWLGMLHAVGRINTHTYADDPSLRSLIDVVPFGVPPEPPAAESRALKGVRPGIGPHDRVLIWGGSILDWQDPATLVRAMARIHDRRRDVKLFFMGTQHPNPQVAPMRAVAECTTLARELGLLETCVFFNDWVPYRERARYLMDADLGLSTHRDHLETHLSFRTRVLDYVWAGLPIVCTRGDFFAGLVEARDLGAVVPPGDPVALADAIVALLDDPSRRQRCRDNLASLAVDLRWDRVVEPLRTFCSQPHLAADRARAARDVRHRVTRRLGFWRWAARTAVRLGVPEDRLEALKQTRAVARGLALVHRLTARRVGRP